MAFRNLSVSGDSLSQSNASSYKKYLIDLECTVIRFVFTCIGSIGLLGNVTVAAIIPRHRIRLDISSSWFVLSLAVADAIFCLTVIPLTNFYVQGHPTSYL